LTTNSSDLILERFLSKCIHFYKFDHEEQIRKGKWEPIGMEVSKKQTHTKTTITNLDVYGIDVEEFAAALKVRCASSTSFVRSNGNFGVVVQGDAKKQACLLLEDYGIPRVPSGKKGKVVSTKWVNMIGEKK
jgi:translation initiation factor 1 (eIF-1/SUI1)